MAQGEILLKSKHCGVGGLKIAWATGPHPSMSLTDPKLKQSNINYLN